MSNRKNRLEGVHPELIRRAVVVLGKMAAAGTPMMVTDGVRTAQEQMMLWLQGRGRPGRIVTYADGIAKEAGGHGKSNHQPWDDGYGHALDCAFMIPGRDPWDETLPWGTYGALAMAEGLEWGGTWPSKKRDLPHIQLP